MAPTFIFYCLAAAFLLLPRLSLSQTTFTCSRATYYGSPECTGAPSGACGYREFGRDVNGGEVAAVSRLYRNGTGCGACYQVRCTHPRLCTEEGVAVVVTDYGQGGYTDFILSARGFVKLARPNLANALMAYGVIDVEYRRVPCKYPGYNMMFKITEHSKFPGYLAFIIIYQGGLNDILGVEIWQEDCKEWKAMRRAYGAVWDMANPPTGPMNVRLLISGDGGGNDNGTDDDDGQKRIELTGVIPCEWKAGASYDSRLQLV